jgi:hypothetical protein
MATSFFEPLNRKNKIKEILRLGRGRFRSAPTTGKEMTFKKPGDATEDIGFLV